jgi:phenylpropionate dioxygenase-like ring-hydroxylating dioxygenase large terminal subunit
MCFDAEGQCVRVPGQDTVPRQARVQNYPLVERHSFAWIWLGDAALADPAKIPDVHWCDHPDWAVSDGYHHFAANYQLVNDNLLDLSHESFVHESLGYRVDPKGDAKGRQHQAAADKESSEHCGQRVKQFSSAGSKPGIGEGEEPAGTRQIVYPDFDRKQVRRMLLPSVYEKGGYPGKHRRLFEQADQNCRL